VTVAAEKVVRYEPRGAARDLFGLRGSEIAIAGPAGTGKSLACLWRVHLAALKYPGIRALVVRKYGVTLGSTTLVTFEEKVARQALDSGVVRWFGGNAKEAACYRYANKSKIVVGGMDKPEKVLSSEYDLVFVDEATELTETDWETLGTRLRHGALPWQQQIAACNPAQPTHWIKTRSDRGTMRMLHSRHRDNPAYYRDDGTLTPQGEDYMAKLDNLTGVRRLRLRDGIWAAAEGVIFEEWDEGLHHIDPFPVPDTWTRWWSCDFGYTNPLVLQMWAEDPDGRLYLYREIYRTKKTVPEHCRDIMETVADEDPHQPGRWIWREKKPRAIICDHDAEGRVVLSQGVGIGTIAAKKGVTDGIQAVQQRMKPAGDGQPRLFIFRGALVHRDPELVDAKKPTCTAEEIPAYIWKVPGPGAQSQAPKEEPLKENDHGADAMRYLCAERAVGAPRIRSMG
jgi:PBSX family phage terminase large subunit